MLPQALTSAGLPLMFEAKGQAAGAEELAANRPAIARALHEAGAVLLRGFGIDSAGQFQQLVARLVPLLPRRTVLRAVRELQSPRKAPS